MYTSTGLFVLYVCFVFCSLTSSKSLKPTSKTSQEWHQELLKMDKSTYGGFLFRSLPAASTGRNYFEHPEPLTEDCVRTARVILNFLTKPSTVEKIKDLLIRSQEKTIVASNQNPTEIWFKNVNAAMKQSKSDFPDFEELKTKVELPHPSKNYLLEIPQQITAVKFLEKPSDVYNEPEFIKLDMMGKFYDYDNLMISNAILGLSKNDTIKSTVDSVFVQARDDYLKDFMAKNAHKIKFLPGENDHQDFAKKVDEYFLKNPLLKEEYKKLKGGCGQVDSSCPYSQRNTRMIFQ